MRQGPAICTIADLAFVPRQSTTALDRDRDRDGYRDRDRPRSSGLGECDLPGTSTEVAPVGQRHYLAGAPPVRVAGFTSPRYLFPKRPLPSYEAHL